MGVAVSLVSVAEGHCGLAFSIVSADAACRKVQRAWASIMHLAAVMPAGQSGERGSPLNLGDGMVRMRFYNGVDTANPWPRRLRCQRCILLLLLLPVAACQGCPVPVAATTATAALIPIFWDYPGAEAASRAAYYDYYAGAGAAAALAHGRYASGGGGNISFPLESMRYIRYK